jgi:hypothetical protein
LNERKNRSNDVNKTNVNSFGLVTWKKNTELISALIFRAI